MAVKPIPDGYHTVTPYLIVPGVARLIDFLTQAFDAKEVRRMAKPDGIIMHAEVRIGDSAIMMGEACGECHEVLIGYHSTDPWKLSMPHRRITEDEWDDEDEPFDADDGEETIPCPYCRRPIHEDAQRCPYCEQYIAQEDAPPTRQPWWIIIAAAAALLIVAMWVLRP